MPLWARFATATGSGGALALMLALLAAAYRSGGLAYWRGLWQYAVEPPFWGTALRFCLVAGIALLVGQAAGAGRAGGGGVSRLVAATVTGAVLGLIWSTYLWAQIHVAVGTAVGDALVLAAAGGSGSLAATWLFLRL